MNNRRGSSTEPFLSSPAAPRAHSVPDDAWQIPWRLEYAAHSGTGASCRRNQDHIKISDAVALFAVADGIGGYRGGEHASLLAVEAVHEYLLIQQQDGLSPDRRLIREAFEAVNTLIREKTIEDSGDVGMATALTVLLLAGSRFYLGHVGNSRAYRVSGGKAKQWTLDHTVVANRVRHGIITPAEAETHPMRKVISRSVGRRSSLEVDVRQGRVRPGDAFVLATSGIARTLDTSVVEAAVASNRRAAGLVHALVHNASNGGARDDLTTLVVRCHKPA